ncbi:HisA/HisF-related TIM barrel protein [Hyphomicrobium sp.]|uniref:HisA/HisF-related TIM barrel protein n=1 Tax=Hyphomicrobium sp. TaxID=82 RepID=UPI0025BCE2EF|nr:HisA/HisF-related TIM barrel protein [Hyphomicrobium sp.]MCC7250346.1 nickel transporter [Hyphomicrobium sp.]
MQVIPVIDIRGGEVVAASRGDRASYRPLVTPLAASADPVAVALGLRSLFPFPTLYVADLDGIEGRGADLATQCRLAEAWPGTELWIDDGTPGPAPADARSPLIKSQRLRSMIKSHVLGSESLTSLSDYEFGRRRIGSCALLSLDFRNDTFLGPPELLEDSALWPDRLIVMTLARVGSGEGPDIERLERIIARAGGRDVYAAGGVRNADDLHALCVIGAAGALVATALHRGNISERDLERIAA